MTAGQEMAVFGDWRSTQLPQYLKLRQWCELTATSYRVAREMVADGRLRAVTSNNGKTYKIPVTELVRPFSPVPVKPKVGE
jgi:excisionase family DNA binding protein